MFTQAEILHSLSQKYTEPYRTNVTSENAKWSWYSSLHPDIVALHIIDELQQSTMHSQPGLEIDGSHTNRKTRVWLCSRRRGAKRKICGAESDDCIEMETVAQTHLACRQN